MQFLPGLEAAIRTALQYHKPQHARTVSLTFLLLLAAVLSLLPAIAAGGNGDPAGMMPQWVPAAGADHSIARTDLAPSRSLESRHNDAGDCYLLSNGEEVHLLRSSEEIAVKYAESMAPDEGLRRLRESPNGKDLELLSKADFGKRGRVDLLQSTTKGRLVDAKSIAAHSSVVFAYPVLLDAESNCRMIPSDELLVRIADGLEWADAEKEITALGVQMIGRAGIDRINVYLLRLDDPKNADPLEVSRMIARCQGVVWAEPNFVREVRTGYTPNDSLFYSQQNMHNIGQNGAAADADVDAPEAWDVSTGSSSVVVAIIDDGVDTGHADLSIAPGGYDFANGDSDPNPIGTNGHGTGCAGIAAGVLNNSYRAAGIAGGCRILPVKIISDTGSFSNNLIIGNAITYAADHADVLSNSWGGGGASSFINDAVGYANTVGRGGKGCPVFFATGNSASRWMSGGSRYRFNVGANLGAGTYSFGFSYSVWSGSPGEYFKIDNVVLLDGDEYTHVNTPLGPSGRQDFEGTFPPPGWTLSSNSGSNLWTATSAGAFGGTGGTRSAYSGDMAGVSFPGGWTELRTPNVSLAGDEILTSAICVSSGWMLYIKVYNSSGTFLGSYGPISGQPVVQTSISYPSSLSTTHSGTCAVGASTDRDFRSDYSQYGEGLDFLAPSSGGWSDIATLDPTGSVGWNGTDYKMNFGGTSAACPLAAGISALMIAVNPDLSAGQIKAMMRNSCDQIGGVTYTNGWNEYYGYGRVNAGRAVAYSGCPSVASVNRLDPIGENTNAGSVTWRVTFSELIDAATVSPSDFTLVDVYGTIAGETVTSAVPVAGSSTTMDVTVNTGSGNGTLRLDVLAAASIYDLAGSEYNSDYTTGQTFIVDKVPPAVTSVNRLVPGFELTNAGSVTWRITFDEAIDASTVQVSDLTLVDVGETITGEALVSVSPTLGLTTTIDVTAGTGTGNGTLRLDVLGGATIYDPFGNDYSSDYTSGQTYSIDKTLLMVNSVNRQTPSAQITRSATLIWRVTFSAPVNASSVSASDFTLVDVDNSMSGEYVTVTSPTSGETTTIDVSASTGSGGMGTLRLDVLASATISDVAGNDYETDYTSGQTYMIDRILPTVTSVDRLSPANQNTNSGSVSWRVTFSELIDATWVSTADFTLVDVSTSITGETKTSTTPVTGSTMTIDVTANTGSGDGTLRLDVLGAATIHDLPGNDYNGNYTSGQTFIIDKTAPTVTAGPPSVAQTNSGPIEYAVTFGESVTGFDEGDDVQLNATGTASAGAVLVAGSGSGPYTVTLSGLTGDGTLGIAVRAGSAIDASGNPNPASTDSEVCDVDALAPAIGNVTSQKADATYGVGEVIDVRVVFDEPVLVTGSPRILLETGATDRYAVYAGGSSTDTLVFEYTVQQGDASADLDYTSVIALDLNDSTVKDQMGNDATLTLPVPGAAGSLGANKNILVNTCLPPDSPLATPDTIAIGGSSVLSAIPGSGGDEVWWYSEACRGIPVGVGPGDQTVSPTTTTTYYAATKNSATGCWSAGCASVTITVIIPTATVAQAKHLGNGESVSILSSAVVAVFGDVFYMEAQDKSSGLRVEKPSHGLSVGSKVIACGTMRTNADNERYLEAGPIVPDGPASVGSILLLNRAVGGGDWFYDSESGAGQKGIEGSNELNNIGLLVSVAGAVTWAGDGCFYIDDGAGILDGSGHVGLRIESSQTVSYPGYVKVTGISSCLMSGSSIGRRILALPVDNP